MSGSTKRIAEFYACDGRNFTSRPADNYEEIFKFLQIDAQEKNIQIRSPRSRSVRNHLIPLAAPRSSVISPEVLVRWGFRTKEPSETERRSSWPGSMLNCWANHSWDPNFKASGHFDPLHVDTSSVNRPASESPLGEPHDDERRRRGYRGKVN